MPSPFPGMDPYLEASEIWVDFHNRLAEVISAELNKSLGRRYIARLSPRVVCEIVDTGILKTIRPDVALYKQPNELGEVQTATAVLTAPVESRVAIEEPVRLHSVEILEVGTALSAAEDDIVSRFGDRCFKGHPFTASQKVNLHQVNGRP